MDPVIKSGRRGVPYLSLAQVFFFTLEVWEGLEILIEAIIVIPRLSWEMHSRTTCNNQKSAK